MQGSEPYLLIGYGRGRKAFEGEGNAALLYFYKGIIRRAVIHIGGSAGKGGIGAHYNGIALHFVVIGILYAGYLGDGEAHALYGIAIGGGQSEVELKVFIERQAADNKGQGFGIVILTVHIYGVIAGGHFVAVFGILLYMNFDFSLIEEMVDIHGNILLGVVVVFIIHADGHRRHFGAPVFLLPQENIDGVYAFGTLFAVAFYAYACPAAFVGIF